MVPMLAFPHINSIMVSLPLAMVLSSVSEGVGCVLAGNTGLVAAVIATTNDAISRVVLVPPVEGDGEAAVSVGNNLPDVCLVH